MSEICARYSKLCYTKFSNRRGTWAIGCPSWRRPKEEEQLKTMQEEITQKIYGCKMCNCIGTRQMLEVAWMGSSMLQVEHNSS